MPKEIDQETNFYSEYLGVLRLEVSELIALLERCNVEPKDITAESNNAKFDGLDDIKSALHRFSGNPTLEFSGVLLNFDRLNTQVSAGCNKLGTPPADLAILITNELKAFHSPIEHIISKVISVLSLAIWLPIIFGVPYISIHGLNEAWNSLRTTISLNPYLGALIFLIFCVNPVVDVMLKRRISVRYRPRETFWQRRGEVVAWSLVSGVIMLVIGKYVI